MFAILEELNALFNCLCFAREVDVNSSYGMMNQLMNS